MNENNNVVDFEPSQHRIDYRSQPSRRNQRVELEDIAGHEVLLLSASIARSFLDGWDMRDRLKNRRIAYMIIGALVVALGLGQLVIQLIKG